MRPSLIISAALHFALLLLAVFGLHLWHKKPLDMPITISVTMMKPSDIARTKHEAEPTKDTDEPPVQSRAPEPPKPPADTAPPPPPPPPVQPKVETPPPPPPKLAPPAPEKPPEKPLPMLEKVEPMQQQSFAPPPKLPPLQKPAEVNPPPRPVTPDKKARQTDEQMDELLKNLTAPVEKADEISRKPPIKAKPQAGSHAQVSDTMTADEMAIIRERLKQCWLVPAGAYDSENLVIHVAAKYNEDKTLIAETLVDTDDRYNRDPSYRAAADSALRALRNPACNPLPWPDGKYADWKNPQIDFDPKMLGQ